MKQIIAFLLCLFFGCSDNTPTSMVFVTSPLYTGAQVSESMCNDFVRGTDLEKIGSFTPWVTRKINGVSVSPIRELSQRSGPWIDTRGNIVFNSIEDFSAHPVRQILYNGLGGEINTLVWTGISYGGVPNLYQCKDDQGNIWSNDTDQTFGLVGVIGDRDIRKGNWTEYGHVPCNTQAAVICITK